MDKCFLHKSANEASRALGLRRPAPKRPVHFHMRSVAFSLPPNVALYCLRLGQPQVLVSLTPHRTSRAIIPCLHVKSHTGSMCCRISASNMSPYPINPLIPADVSVVKRIIVASQLFQSAMLDEIITFDDALYTWKEC
jgi:hypothetical protein